MPTTPNAPPKNKTCSQSKTRSQEDFEQGLREHLTAQRRGRATAVPGANRVRCGLPLGVLDDIKETVDLGWNQLGSLLGTSARTLQRRRQRSEDLTPAESDRLWRLLHVWRRAAEALGSEEAARTWLIEPHGLLGGESPLGRLDTEPGLREVEDMLTVIDETAAA